MKKIKIFVLVVFLFFSLSLADEAYNVSNSRYMSKDVSIAVNQQDEIMAVWTEIIGPSNHKIFFSIFSSDEWSSPKAVPGQSTISKLPDVTRGRRGGFVVVWHQEQKCNCIKLARYNGGSWGNTMTVSQNGGYEMGRPAVKTTTSRIAVIWQKGNPLFTDAYVNVWNGRWTGIKQISISGYHCAAKVPEIYSGPNGKFYAAWEEVRDKSEIEEMLEIVFTQDNGSNMWRTPLDVTNFRERAFRPTISVDSNGDVLVTYFKDRAYWGVVRNSGQWSEPMYIGNGGHEHELYYSDSASIGNGFIFVWRDLGYNIRYAVYREGEWSEDVLVASGDTYHPAVDYNSDVKAAVAWTDRNKNDVLVNIFDIEAPVQNDPPIAKFEFSPKTGLYPLKVNFDASKSYDPDGQIISYFWSFGDGVYGSGRKTSHTYRKKGDYPVALTVKDNDGATDSAYGMVEVLGIYPPLNQKYELKINETLFVKEYFYKVTWDRNPKNAKIGANIVKYRIYRRRKGYRKYNYLDSVSANNFIYYDRSLKTEKVDYEYAVTALDDEGRESSIEE